MNQARIVSLHCYPIKSARGWSLADARLVDTGFQHDREWLVIRDDGMFITQREEPRLATLEVRLHDALELRAPGQPALLLPLRNDATPRSVRIWRHQCAAFDCGPDATAWLTAWLGYSAHLVRFDHREPRYSNREWTGDRLAANAFSDGYPILVAGVASLADLNARLQQPLPMERFRPNIVLDGLEAYAEDRIDELRAGDVILKLVKPCERCIITTTDQQSGVRTGDEPLRTLRSYRYSAELHGVTFAQNAIIVSGQGATLRVDQHFEVRWK